MSFETIDVDWSLDYCLACDKQTNGGVYCSEACRLADYESANSGSEASSPMTPHGAGSWPMTKPGNNGLVLQPAFNYAAFRPYGSTPTPKSSNAFFISRPQSSPVQLSKPVLTPSSSQSSLFSMQSSSSSQSTADQSQLSEEARKELRAYANCFDQSRYTRRQSTY